MNIIDLFSGIGGLRLGFEQAFGEMGKATRTVFSSEIDKFAIQTYRANFGNEEIWGDINEIDPARIPRHDILLAGFPCQPFSNAGLKRGFEDEGRGDLFFAILKILKEKKPRMFLLENVKGLKSHNRGQTLNEIVGFLGNAGYKVFYKVLAATDFGLPQNRQRIFIVGFRDESVSFNFPEPSKKSVRVGDILEKNVDPKHTLSKTLWEGHKRRREQHRAKGNGFGYGLFYPDSPYTNTISARYYKDGSEVLISQGKGKRPRKLTARECARLQGFPDSFKIPVSDNQAYKQFGNSVPVNVVKAIAKNMLVIS